MQVGDVFLTARGARVASAALVDARFYYRAVRREFAHQKRLNRLAKVVIILGCVLFNDKIDVSFIEPI